MNSIIAKSGVRRIEDDELQYIVKFDGSMLVYRFDTPTKLLPVQGVKLYYDNINELFPYGLCAEVVGINTTSEGIALRLQALQPNDVFEQYFISGDFELAQPMSFNGREKTELGVNFPVELKSEIVDFRSATGLELHFDNLVASVLTGYYSADIRAVFKSDMELAIRTPDLQVNNLESARTTVMRGIIGGVISPKLDALAFMDIEADASVGLCLERMNTIKIHWIHKNGTDTFSLIEDSAAIDKDNKNEFTTDFVMSGRIHFGFMADLSFNTLFNVVGVGISAKFGPEFKSDFSAAVVRNLSNDFKADDFAKAEAETSLLTKIETYSYSIFSQGVKTKLPFEVEFSTLHRTFHLLPEFSSRAVRCQVQTTPGIPSDNNPAVSIASISETPVARDLTVGFALENNNGDMTLAKEFVKNSLAANSSEPQGFSAYLPTNINNMTQLIARPVVKYAGNVLKFPPTQILDNACIQPIYASIAGPAAYMVAGAQIIGQADNETDSYIIGNNMPIVAVNPVFADDSKRTFKMLDFINSDGTQHCGSPEATIFGTWRGEIGDCSVVMAVNSDMSASYNAEPAVASFNNPQAGNILLDFGRNRNIIIEIIDVTATSLKISFKNSTEIYTLTK